MYSLDGMCVIMVAMQRVRVGKDRMPFLSTPARGGEIFVDLYLYLYLNLCICVFFGWNVRHIGDNAAGESNKQRNALFIDTPARGGEPHSRQEGDCPKDISLIPRIAKGGNGQE